MKPKNESEPDDNDWISKGLAIWICGRVHNSVLQPWGILGVYTDRDRAIARCTKATDFAGPIPLNVDLPDSPTVWPGIVWPRMVLPVKP